MKEQSVERRIIPFFCDECGVELSTAYACPDCKRILCHKHYFGRFMGPFRRKDGLCVGCAEEKRLDNEAKSA